MRVELLVTRDSSSCRKAETLWRTMCEKNNLTLRVLEDDSPEGREALERLGLHALPAVLLDGRLVAVGVQTPDQASELLRSAGIGRP
jgi:predicted thioredoxin/glutaredoxin